MNELSLKRFDALVSMIKSTLHDSELGINSVSITFSNGQAAVLTEKSAKPTIAPEVLEQQYNELKADITNYIRDVYENEKLLQATVSHLARATGKTKRHVIYHLRKLANAGKLEMTQKTFELSGNVKKMIKFVDVDKLLELENELSDEERLIAAAEADVIKKRVVDQVMGLEESDMKVLE